MTRSRLAGDPCVGDTRPRGLNLPESHGPTRAFRARRQIGRAAHRARRTSGGDADDSEELRPSRLGSCNCRAPGLLAQATPPHDCAAVRFTSNLPARDHLIHFCELRQFYPDARNPLMPPNEVHPGNPATALALRYGPPGTVSRSGRNEAARRALVPNARRRRLRCPIPPAPDRCVPGCS